MVAVTDSGAWAVTTPLLPQVFTGAGDITAAIFLANLLRSDLATALGRTAAVVYGVLRATVDSGESELQLVAAQDEIADRLGHASRCANFVSWEATSLRGARAGETVP